MPDLPWFVYAMLLAPLGLILVAAVYKTLQVRAAREWPSTPGKVVVSKSELREVKVIDSDREDGHRFEQRNFANIIYEYSVSGQKLRNNRVSIGEDLGNFQVAETIAKYPVGTVVTVYYNPRHPREAVLERDLPQGLWGCLGIATVIAVVDRVRCGDRAHAHRGIRQRADWSIRRCRCRSWRWARSVWSRPCSRWCCTASRRWRKPGRSCRAVIKLSGLEEYRAAPSDSGRRGSIMYERKVSYSYRFKDVAYTGVHGSFSSNSQDDVAMGGAAVRDGFSGRRQRQGLGQSGQSVGGDAQSARAVRLAAVADRRGICGPWPI